MVKLNIITYEGSDRLEKLKDLSKDFKISIYSGKKVMPNEVGIEHRKSCIEAIIDNYNEPYTIIVEDDVIPTEYFSVCKIQELIESDLDYDVLITGVGMFGGAEKHSEDILKLDYFRGTQFVIIRKKCYDIILKDTGESKFFEGVLSTNDLKLMLTVPFLTKQGGFPSRIIGVHNVTPRFEACEIEALNILQSD